MLSLSSNQLSSIPSSFVEVGSCLKEVYLNGNIIKELPKGLGEKLTGLVKLNLAHNHIGGNNNVGNEDGTNNNNDHDDMDDSNDDNDELLLPKDFVQRFGMPDPPTGHCTKDEQCLVRMEGNPLAEKRESG